MTINELTEQFALENVAKFEAAGDLTDIVIASSASEARICLQGAHVTHWRPAGDRAVLWMSEKTLLEKGKAIRGGIPICFPWFGPHKDNPQAPPHGFARLMEWSVESISKESAACAKAVLVLKADDRTKQYWGGQFELRLTVTVAEALTMTLETKNVGDEAFTITEALHTYFAVSDCQNVTIAGLENTEYLDKLEGAGRKNQDETPITFSGETDRVYLDTEATCVLSDPSAGRRISVAKSGSDSTVIWNPWADKAAAMPDFGDDEWSAMVCIETANVADNAVTIDPGETHALQAQISIL